MAFQIQVGDTVEVRGTLNVASGTLSLKDDQIAKSRITRADLTEYPIKLVGSRIWDAVASGLPATASADDLGIVTGTWGTDVPTVQTSDAKNTTVTQRMYIPIELPEGYIAGETLTLRIRAGMITTVASASATVDVEAYINDGDGAAGSDICATAAQSINSLTKANKDFTITPTGLTQADLLHLRITIAITDSATATAVIGEISKLALLADVR
jgi:hypothetical protein